MSNLARRPVRILNYGGGVNSTANIVEAVRRREEIDLIIFSFTGSEPPEVHWEQDGQISGYIVEHMRPWLARRGMDLVIVRWIRKRNDRRTLPIFGDLRGKFLPLHEWCEKLNQVPSKAFGKMFDGCSSKWKRQVVDEYVREIFAPSREALARGEKVERWLGYDLDEPTRHLKSERRNITDPEFIWRSPLIEWKMGRAECVEAIQAAGLPVPRKSACWMCPSTKPHEVDQLGREHPELLERALRMERNAIAAGNLGAAGGVRGLGGRFNWNDYVAGRQTDTDVAAIPCDCFDESEDT